MKSSTKRIRFSWSQMETLIETMETNPKLYQGVLSSKYNSSQRQADWSALCAKLNKDGGAVKSIEKWQKCWSDYKHEVKRRFHGQIKCKRFLSPIEERVIALLGLESEGNEDNSKSQAMDLEISKVESIKNNANSGIELEESASNLESNDSRTMTPEESLTVRNIKIEPEELSRTIQEAKNMLNSDRIASLGLKSNDIILVPLKTGSFNRERTQDCSEVQNAVTLDPKSKEMILVPVGTRLSTFNSERTEEGSEVQNTTTSNAKEMIIVPVDPGLTSYNREGTEECTEEQSTVSRNFNDVFRASDRSVEAGSSSFNRNREKTRDILEDLNAKRLIESQNATAGALQAVAKALETISENQQTKNANAEAMQSVAKALETLAENQKVQLSIEERRTAMFEKLINYFCRQ